MSESAPAETLALLGRLSSKAGVRSTLILSRSTGSIVQSSGFVATQSAGANGTEGGSYDQQSSGLTGTDQNEISAEKVAKAVWTFVNAADAMASDISPDDDVRLLRLRLKRQEVVIVPNAKFLLVVMHDTT